jgi:hypothetical protein
MEQQYKKSGLSSYWDWLQATEADMHKSLAEVGFEIVTRDGRTFIDEIKPHSKRNVKKAKTAQVGKTKSFIVSSHSSQSKTVKHKNYDDYIEDSAAPELHLVREARTSANKIKPPSQKKPVKYKTTAKRRTKNLRKK